VVPPFLVSNKTHFASTSLKSPFRIIPILVCTTHQLSVMFLIRTFLHHRMFIIYLETFYIIQKEKSRPIRFSLWFVHIAYVNLLMQRLKHSLLYPDNGFLLSGWVE
jgi:hypothetical protein